jgi:hypothetical protein
LEQAILPETTDFFVCGVAALACVAPYSALSTRDIVLYRSFRHACSPEEQDVRQIARL